MSVAEGASAASAQAVGRCHRTSPLHTLTIPPSAKRSADSREQLRATALQSVEIFALCPDGPASGPRRSPATARARTEYQWHPEIDGGSAAPDGPAAVTTIEAHPDTNFTLPAASVAVLRGKVAMHDAR